jgi:hypothetical protein
MTPEQQENFIAKTVREFEVALRIMARDKSNTHVFDLGTGYTVETGKMESWSLLIIMAPTETINQLGLAMQDSKPLAASN